MADVAPEPLATPHPLGDNAVTAISEKLNGVLADAFTLYVKTKNFHWHVSGPRFRSIHLMLDDQADQIFAMTDDVAERVRKIGGRTLTSIKSIAANSVIKENDADYVPANEMLAELAKDNRVFAARLREAHEVADENDDFATTSLIENWLDETEKRAWFLFESTRKEVE
jgi:starvation-inducible DNA-binding protein